MQLTSTPRRALGLVAVGALGMTTAALGATGVASAASPMTFTFSTDSSANVDQAGIGTLEMPPNPADTCTIAWVLDGAAGGAGNGSGAAVVGLPGGRYTVTTEASGTDLFKLFPGGQGGDAPLSGTSTGGDAGTNGSSSGGNGVAGGYDGSVYSGGGGAASVVEHGGDLILAAYGGHGGLAETSLQGEGLGGFEGVHQNRTGEPGIAENDTNTGAGVISGTVTCTTPEPAPEPAPEVDAPSTPTVNWIEGGEKSATMQIWAGYRPEGSTPVYEYSLDGGAWMKLATSAEFQIEPTITGLVNGKTYSVRVRVTVNGISSEPTAAQKVTPRHIVGAPTKATVTTGPGSLTISWAPPADATGVTGYMAWALPGAQPQSSAGLVECPEMDAAARSCTIGVPVDSEYSVGIRALDANGSGDAAWLLSDVVEAGAAAPALPKSSGALSTDKGAVSTVAQGGTVTLTGGGYLPFSTVTLVMYSDPVVLGTTEADADGNISATVTLPAGVSGEHTLVASGVDASGQPHNLTMAVTVSAGKGLPNTGASIGLPALGGLVALAAGGGLLFAARRRTAA